MSTELQGGIMNIWQNRIRPLGADQCSEDGIARETHAACTAWAWLGLYGIAIAGSLFFGNRQHKHEIPVVAAVATSLEHSK
jgi:hypothetical protein